MTLKALLIAAGLAILVIDAQAKAPIYAQATTWTESTQSQ